MLCTTPYIQNEYSYYSRWMIQGLMADSYEGIFRELFLNVCFPSIKNNEEDGSVNK